MAPASAGGPRVGAGFRLASAAMILAACVWSYWRIINELIDDWQGDPNYSVGALVPFAVLYLLWGDAKKLSRLRLDPCWWGIVLIVAAQAVRLYGLADLRESIERYSMVLTVFGLVLLVAGWQVFLRSFWAMALLFFMMPLPGSVHNMISGPLQTWATTLAVYTLELIGVTVVREGNTMMLEDSVPVAVAEACSGLRMLTAFVVVAWVLAYVVHRPTWQKVVLAVSSVPVAIVCNLARLVVTSLLFMYASSRLAERFSHDFAGVAMMPVAVLILLGELWVMSKLVTEERHA